MFRLVNLKPLFRRLTKVRRTMKPKQVRTGIQLHKDGSTLRTKMDVSNWGVSGIHGQPIDIPFPVEVILPADRNACTGVRGQRST